jgi:hypothetical protein
MGSGDTVGHVLPDPDRVGHGGQARAHRADQVDYDRAARIKQVPDKPPAPVSGVG